jgi:phage terminase small subunit
MDEVTAELRRLNPLAKEMRIAIAANLISDYRAAAENIRANGTIVLHPRTGEPIANPYIAIRDRAAKQLLELRLDCGSMLSHT